MTTQFFRSSNNVHPISILFVLIGPRPFVMKKCEIVVWNPKSAGVLFRAKQKNCKVAEWVGRFRLQTWPEDHRRTEDVCISVGSKVKTPGPITDKDE